jgi:two-component system, NarL family, nitrate/nitrite response regulator NarL
MSMAEAHSKDPGPRGGGAGIGSRGTDAATTRVLVVEDHPLYRTALEAAISRHNGLSLVGAVADGRRALEMLVLHEPDVMVLDISLPDRDGIWVLDELARTRSATRALVLSGDESATTICQALAAGAAGYIIKDVEGDAICAAIVAVARGEDVVARRLQRAVTAEFRRLTQRPILLLTEREREVLSLAAQGRSTADMGRLLHVSAATVKTHLAHAYRKLGVSDRAAAVAEGARRGIIDLEGPRR